MRGILPAVCNGWPIRGGADMYGHPYGQGWRAIMRADRRRRVRRLMSAAAAGAALLYPVAWEFGRIMGAW